MNPPCSSLYTCTLHTPEEDLLESYSRVLLKMFLSEGVLCGHSLFLASAREDPAEMIKVTHSSRFKGTLTGPRLVTGDLIWSR